MSETYYLPELARLMDNILGADYATGTMTYGGKVHLGREICTGHGVSGATGERVALKHHTPVCPGSNRREVNPGDGGPVTCKMCLRYMED